MGPPSTYMSSFPSLVTPMVELNFSTGTRIRDVAVSTPLKELSSYPPTAVDCLYILRQGRGVCGPVNLSVMGGGG